MKHFFYLCIFLSVKKKKSKSIMKHLFICRYIFIEEEGVKRLFYIEKDFGIKKPLINNGFYELCTDFETIQL